LLRKTGIAVLKRTGANTDAAAAVAEEIPGGSADRCGTAAIARSGDPDIQLPA
jgi:hypothetical protein